MKKTVSVIVLMLIMLTCMRFSVFLPGEGEAANCFLCGMNEESLMSLYRGRNSLGILCTDRFSVADVFAQKSKLSLKKKDSGNRMRFIMREGPHGSIAITEDTERGISDVDIDLEEADRLSMEDLRGKLCGPCLEKFERLQKESDAFSADVFLVDLKTAEIYSLSRSRHFLVGDYLLLVDAAEEQIDVTAVYAPQGRR